MKRQIGFAILLKSFQLMARFPNSDAEIPDLIISYIASQLKIDPKLYPQYNWQGRSLKNHRAEIRQLFGFRTATLSDSESISNWLIENILPNEQRFEPLLQLIYQKFRNLQIEPPTPQQVERLIRSAIHQHEILFCNQTFSQLTSTNLKQIDLLLTTEETTNKLVTGKTNLLFRIAEVAVAQPSGVIQNVIYPVVSQQTLRDLVKEYKSTGIAYRQRVYTVMRT